MRTPRARLWSIHANLSLQTAKPYEVKCEIGLLVRIRLSTRRISKTYDDNPLIQNRFQSNTDVRRSHTEDAAQCLHHFFRQGRDRFCIAIWRRTLCRICWPVSRSRVEEGLLFEQQMFLPHDESTVAMSWALHANTATAAQLVVRPFFSGCGPRSYRDGGFHADSENNEGRLTWLPHVWGPRLFADTNGRYSDEAVPSLDCLCDEAASSSSTEDLITPGRFEFQLSRRPAVLIISAEDRATTRHCQYIGVFLAGLMQETTPALAKPEPCKIAAVETQQPVVA
jgi:hypothetical protein